MLFNERFARNQDSGGTVVDARRITGRYRAIFSKRRFEAGKFCKTGFTWMFVPGEKYLFLPAAQYFDTGYFFLPKVFVKRHEVFFLGTKRKFVLVFPRYFPLARNIFCRFPHGIRKI